MCRSPDRSGGDRDAPPCVSIIIPCYNGAKFLARTLASCRDQSWPAVEIIVVDDGSRDSSVAIARSFPEVTCIEQANAGTSAARNRGLAAATGDFVVFLDHDDELTPDAVRIGVDLLRAMPEVSFVAGNARLIGADDLPLPRQPADIVPEGPVTYAQVLRPWLRTPPALLMFRTGMVRRLGGFDAGLRCYGEDYDLYLRCLREAPAWRHLAHVANYRRHADNASGGLPRMLAGLLDVHARQRALIGDDPALLAAWREGRRAWQRYYGRWLPGYALRRLARGEVVAALGALRLIAANAPASLEGAVGHWMPAIAPEAWCRPEWPAGRPPAHAPRGQGLEEPGAAPFPLSPEKHVTGQDLGNLSHAP